jgi:hypothetical protein
MKRVISFLLIAFAFVCMAQTNAVSAFTTYDNGSSFVVNVTFTLDSLAGMATPTFKVPDGAAYDFSSYPVTFKRKCVSTYGTNPAYSIFLQGVYATDTDTMSLDTVSLGVVAQSETDSLGLLTLNQWSAPAYKIYLRCLNADINSGLLTLVFPKKEAFDPAYIKRR